MSYALFIYGSLRNPDVFERVTNEKCPPREPATLEGYALGKPIDGYPALYPDQDSVVEGELLRNVSSQALQCLDEYEEVGVEYERRQVSVSSSQGPIEAFVYVGL